MTTQNAEFFNIYIYKADNDLNSKQKLTNGISQYSNLKSPAPSVQFIESG